MRRPSTSFVGSPPTNELPTRTSRTQGLSQREHFLKGMRGIAKGQKGAREIKGTFSFPVQSTVPKIQWIVIGHHKKKSPRKHMHAFLFVSRSGSQQCPFIHHDAQHVQKSAKAKTERTNAHGDLNSMHVPGSKHDIALYLPGSSVSCCNTALESVQMIAPCKRSDVMQHVEPSFRTCLPQEDNEMTKVCLSLSYAFRDPHIEYQSVMVLDIKSGWPNAMADRVRNSSIFTWNLPVPTWGSHGHDASPLLQDV